jgi:hypothetical protein
MTAMANDNVVQLPNLHERFWSGFDTPRARALLLSRGFPGDAIDAAFESVKRRFRNIPIKAIFPLDQAEHLTEVLSTAMHEIFGAMIVEMIELELEIYYLKNGRQYYFRPQL